MLTCVWVQVKCLIPFPAEHFEITLGVIVLFEQLSPHSFGKSLFSPLLDQLLLWKQFQYRTGVVFLVPW